MTDVDRRSAIADAWGQLEDAGEGSPAGVEPAVEAAPEPIEATEATVQPEVETAEAKRARDEAGRFSKAKTEEPKPAVKPTPAKTVAPVPAKAADPAAAPPKPEIGSKAPGSWSPTLREKWGTLPEDIRKHVAKQEREVNLVLQQTAEARKNWQSFTAAVQPYEAMIRAEGGEPIRAVAGLLQSAALLRTGPPAAKAQLVAQIIKSYGVDIKALDDVLAGESPQQPQHHGQYRDPRLDQLLAQAQATKQQRAAESSRQNMSAIEAFEADSANEFFDSVREDMADLIDLAESKGSTMTLKQAYDRACLMNPEVSQALQQREKAKAAAAAQTATQAKKAAASSVRGQPSSTARLDDQPKTRREAIEAAFDSQS